jgi:hypothetical protein
VDKGSAHDVADRLRRSAALRWSARAGLVARAALHFVLAYLAAAVVVSTAGDSRQVNANGAMRTIAATSLGKAGLALAGLGFAAFALVRVAGAFGDRRGGRLRRLTTAGQAAFYAIAAGTAFRFLVGDHSTGSEQQQHSTVGRLLAAPEGRVALFAVGGAVVLGIASWQVHLAVRGGFADSLQLDDLTPRRRRLVLRLSAVAVAARACCIAPLGLLCIIAAVADRASDAPGLDGLLARLAEGLPGRVLVVLVAAGFLAFALYSLLEARYREVHAGT